MQLNLEPQILIYHSLANAAICPEESIDYRVYLIKSTMRLFETLTFLGVAGNREVRLNGRECLFKTSEHWLFLMFKTKTINASAKENKIK